MNPTKSVRRYAYLMKTCGYWPIARMLYKQGYPINYALFCAQYAAMHAHCAENMGTIRRMTAQGEF